MVVVAAFACGGGGGRDGGGALLKDGCCGGLWYLIPATWYAAEYTCILALPRTTPGTW